MTAAIVSEHYAQDQCLLPRSLACRVLVAVLDIKECPVDWDDVQVLALAARERKTND